MTYPGSPVFTVEALRRHKSITLGALADELDQSLESVAANVGGLHDVGLATKYGNHPGSLARWDGPDTDYVLSCLEAVEACRNIRLTKEDA